MQRFGVMSKQTRYPHQDSLLLESDLFRKTIAGETEAFDDLHLQV